MSPDVRAEWLRSIDTLTLEAVLNEEWWVSARPEQICPIGDWHVWLILSGRGWGKTRTGAEWLIDQALQHPADKDGIPTEWGAFAQTNTDSRLVLVEGPSGLLNVLRKRGIQYSYQIAPLKLTLPEGQRIHARGADDPDVGRGLNLAGAWLDELAKWRYAQKAWDEGIGPSLRVLAPGTRPRAVITTTPKPLPILKDFLERTDGSVHITRGATWDNAANLSPQALKELRHRYEGTRLGRQELYGELLMDVEGSLWTLAVIEEAQVSYTPDDVIRRVVAVDPAVTSGEHSDETGIITAAMCRDQRVYIENDASLRASPDTWARRVVQEYYRVEADAVIVEGNQGGDLHKTVIHTVDPNVNVKRVSAGSSKYTRAEPVAALYEQGRVRHVGRFPLLEQQMTEWTPEDSKSPDRIDALVWAVSELAFRHKPGKVQSFGT